MSLRKRSNFVIVPAIAGHPGRTYSRSCGASSGFHPGPPPPGPGGLPAPIPCLRPLPILGPDGETIIIQVPC